MMLHRLPVGILLALATLLGAASCQRAPDASAPTAAKAPPVRKVPVRVAAVGSRDVKLAIDTIGTLEAREVVRIPARVAGVLERVRFEQGMSVRADTVLARVDPERYKLAAARADANLAQAAAQSRETEAAFDKRQRLREKDPGWVTAEELSNFQARVDAARAEVDAARAARELAAKDLRDSEVKPGSAGVINEKLADTGQFIQAGAPIATMVDIGRLKLVFKLSETESVRLDDTSRISFHVKSIPGREYTARLFHINRSADPMTRQVECLAWVDDPERTLRPGSFADVTIEVGAGGATPIVPETAVLPTDRGFVAWVLKGEDEVESRVLTLGLRTRDGQVEVLDGLKTGERLVVRGGGVLGPASRVQVETSQETP